MQERVAQEIKPCADDAAAWLLLFEPNEVASGIGEQAAVAAGVRRIVTIDRAGYRRVVQYGDGVLYLCENQRVAVHYHPGRSGLSAGAHGVKKTAGGSHRSRFRSAGDRSAVYGMLLNITLNYLGPITSGDNYTTNSLLEQVTDEPLDARPVRHRRHRFRNVRQQVLNAGAESPGQDDSGDLLWMEGVQTFEYLLF